MMLAGHATQVRERRHFSVMERGIGSRRKSMANKKLRVGIVSANWGALAHLPAWRLLGDDVEVTAICTSRQESAEAAAAQYDVARPFWGFAGMGAAPALGIIYRG